MSIDLWIEPGKVYTWEDFLIEKPPFSIGLDGIVSGPTMRDNYGPYANFDHHHPSIDRLSTRSTSAQVHMEINMGLFDVFKKKGVPYANIFINDPDEDADLSSFQLRHHELVKGHGNPKLNRLVYCEDMLDCTAGAYPFGDIRIRRQMAWIFLPYTEARFEKRLGDMGISEMRDIVEAVHGRIEQYLFEECGEIALEGHYERIGGGKKWSLVKETGPAARMALYNDKINAFVSLLGENGGGTLRYTVNKRSPWTPFDNKKVYDICNEEEKILGLEITEENKWGGSDLSGGSPRDTGSLIKPDRLEKILNDILEE